MATPWIQTYTGMQFFPLDPKPEQVRIEDIAHALSNVCRFAGHVNHHYSVATHSICVSLLLEKEHGKSAIDLCMVGLLHDAAEAYFGDIPKPVKDVIPNFKEIEERIIKAVEAKLMPGVDTAPLWPLVFQADMAYLCAEAKKMFSSLVEDWTTKYIQFVPESMRRNPEHVVINAAPDQTEQAFMDRYKELLKRKSENS